MTFLWRAQGRPEPSSSVSPFTDVTDKNAYYYDAVLWAVEEGLVNGVGGNRFDLHSTLAYDQMMALMCRAAGGDAGGADWSEKAMAWAEDSGLMEGLTLSAKAPCPRRDVVYCLWKQPGNGGEDPEETQQPEETQKPEETAVLANGQPITAGNIRAPPAPGPPGPGAAGPPPAAARSDRVPCFPPPGVV